MATRLVLNPSTGAPQAQVHHLSGAPGVDHLELGALGAAPEQANTVAEHDGQHVNQDLVHEAGPEALAGDVTAEYEDVLPVRGGQGRGDGLADVARDEDVLGIGLVLGRGVGEDEDRPLPASAEGLAGLRPIGPAPDLVAELGERAGYSREAVRVLRTRRSSSHRIGLKESAVVMRNA